LMHVLNPQQKSEAGMLVGVDCRNMVTFYRNHDE
jgi:hypothetical protein